ncbi:MAG: cytochrome c biogenesis protein CcsA, partial [Armatimonadota bacterium]
CMGGFWAYETLGWGGFWMWDPVENTSFVPWCAAVALVHGIIIQVSRKKGHLTNLWLGAAPFLLFCYGTFLTRSGFLIDASVHSFAKMNSVALYILEGVIFAALIGFTGIFLWRYKALKAAVPQPPKGEGFWSKEAFYTSGIWLTCSIGLFTAIGMSVPLIQALQRAPAKVVEERLYHQVLVWPFIPLLLLMAVGPVLSWRGMPLKEVWLKVANPLAISIGLTGGLILWLRNFEGGIGFDPKAKTLFFGSVTVDTWWWIALLCGICTFSIICNLSRLIRYAPREWAGRGGLIAHVGLGMAMAGLIG